jgi:hypothetical protein
MRPARREVHHRKPGKVAGEARSLVDWLTVNGRVAATLLRRPRISFFAILTAIGPAPIRRNSAKYRRCEKQRFDLAAVVPSPTRA